MRLEDSPESQNVEDRRGVKPAQAALGGGAASGLRPGSPYRAQFAGWKRRAWRGLLVGWLAGFVAVDAPAR